MTRRQYELARTRIGQVEHRARKAHQKRNYAERDILCRLHDNLVQDLRGALGLGYQR